MDRMYKCIDETIYKSTIECFRKFLGKFPDVTKWFMCSDYCIKDKSKPNDVVSFVLFPYLVNFDEWNRIIGSMQKKDLKHSRTISNEFCEFSQKGYFFCFTFVLKEGNVLDKWQDKNTTDVMLNSYITMIQNWIITTPNNAVLYNEMIKRFRKLQNESKQKTFNYKMCGRIVEICFLAAYLRCLLLREKNNVEIYSWLSDRDAITDWQNGIYLDLYHIISYTICDNKLSRTPTVKDLELKDVQQHQFYDDLNRVADYICGCVADFDYKNKINSSNKHSTLMEKMISDNENIIILRIDENGVSRIVHNYIK